jgi:hypothetical protein
MFKFAGMTRSVLLGVLCALVAFSYSIASVPSVFGPSVGIRAASTNAGDLHFTNPLDVNGNRDLGDVVLGSQFSRLARAAGGIPPYLFSSPTGTGISKFVSTQLSSASVDFSGLITGSVAPTLVSGGPTDLVFLVNVKDQTVGTNGVTEPFSLKIDQSGVFKFAFDKLGEAVQFGEFAAQIETINGAGTVAFTVGAVTGVTGVTALDDIGLVLTSDGLLYGKPYVSGTFTFTVSATDSLNQSAKSRDQSATGQVFTLTVTASNNITSDVVITKGQISYDGAKSATKPKDSVSLAGLVNLKGAALSSLSNDKFDTVIGGFDSLDQTLEVSLDTRGKGASSDKRAKVALNSKGTFKSSYKKVDISALFPSLTEGTPDPLYWDVKGSGTKQKLTYSLGKSGTPAGGFLITAVKGKDNKDGTGTAFQVAFVGIPGARTANANGNFTGATGSSVAVGSFSSPSLTVSESNGKVKGKGDKSDDTVNNLKLDAVKGKGAYKTNVILTTSSGLALAGDGTASQVFATGVQVSAGSTELYNGFGTTTIFPKKTSYSNKNPVK